MTIEKLDKAACRQIREAIAAALDVVAADLGVAIEVGGGSFDAVGVYNPKVKVTIEGAAEREFARNAPLVGLKASDYGRVLRYAGNDYRLTAINLRAPRFPVHAERVSDGRGIKFPEAAVLFMVDQADKLEATS